MRDNHVCEPTSSLVYNNDMHVSFSFLKEYNELKRQVITLEDEDRR